LLYEAPETLFEKLTVMIFVCMLALDMVYWLQIHSRLKWKCLIYLKFTAISEKCAYTWLEEVVCVSNYEFSLRQEVLLEKGADILGTLFHFARSRHISLSDKRDPINVIYGMVWDAKSRILGAVTEADLDHIETEFDFARRFYSELVA